MSSYYMQTSLILLGSLLLFGGVYYMNSIEVSAIDHGFTADFQSFLDSVPEYKAKQFNRPTITWPCFGGYTTRPTGKPARYPIVFIHGNSDIGVGNGGTVGWQTGWTAVIEYLQANKGYTKQDLYVTTWGKILNIPQGPANPNLASQNAHSEEYIMYVRKFIEAVIAYTNAEKIYVMGHSMGVTLARAALIGGKTQESLTKTYDIGPNLKNKVEAFFGLAGANWGLKDCQFATGLPTCNTYTGFSPSSKLLNRIAAATHQEATYVYSFWSPADDIIKHKCLVGTHNTCIVPGSDKSFEYKGETHFNVRDNHGKDIAALLTK